jgi:hypothetical protein
MRLWPTFRATSVTDRHGPLHPSVAVGCGLYLLSALLTLWLLSFLFA